MKKKTIAVAAMASCMAISASLTGCSLVSTNNRADMAQTIATINIADAVNEQELAPFKSAIGQTTIVKRNLVSYFLNVGYSYIQNGSSYEDTFNMLMDGLVNNAVLVQYSTLKILEEKAKTDGEAAVLAQYTAADKTKAQKYEYLLGDEDEILLAKYNLLSSLNTAIDNYENVIIEEEDGYTGTETRTTPINLNTEQDDYFPETASGELDYNLYTGYSDYLLADSGKYAENALEGTTRATRIKAYNTFINNLKTNNLIDIETEAEYIKKDIFKIGYIQDEYATQLEARIINKYYDIYEDELQQQLLSGETSYVESVYNELLADQTNLYKEASSFESALSGMSSSSFLLYSPDTDDAEFDFEGNYGTDHARFGLVYNILLPFNAVQSAKLAELNSIKSADEDDDYFYTERNKLLRNIRTEDQRAAWFNGTENYSFRASESDYNGGYYNNGSNSDYLFFEGNLTESEEGERYKKLQAYEGKYPYNGRVSENDDGSFTLLGNRLDIDGMLAEFEAYIEYVLGDDTGVTFNETLTQRHAYYDETQFKTADGGKEIDYSKFLYASGRVNFGEFKNDDLFNRNASSKQYKAMSAVNELQFAYTTDTSVLSQYAGYSVSAYSTNYIKEFEYAAKLAISNGEGAFTVCAGDYGWHLIYVTYVFDKQEMYSPVWTWDRINEEGTFENLFFEWIKSNNLSDVTNTRRNKIIRDYNKENVTVVKYQSRYQDLLDLEN